MSLHVQVKICRTQWHEIWNVSERRSLFGQDSHPHLLPSCFWLRNHWILENMRWAEPVIVSTVGASSQNRASHRMRMSILASKWMKYPLAVGLAGLWALGAVLKSIIPALWAFLSFIHQRMFWIDPHRHGALQLLLCLAFCLVAGTLTGKAWKN